ncbi:hypothetical protein NBRC116596_20450 [Litorivita sp. NS0012-18]
MFLDAIEGDEPLEHADLRRRQPDAGGVIHGFEHVFGQLAARVGEIFDGVALLFEARIGMYQNRPYHGLHLGDAGGACNGRGAARVAGNVAHSRAQAEAAGGAARIGASGGDIFGTCKCRSGAILALAPRGGWGRFWGKGGALLCPSQRRTQDE